MRVKLQVNGFDEIRKRLERLAVETVQDHLREAGRAGAEIIRQDASGRVNLGPHRQHLRDSLVIEEVRERDSRVDFGIGPDRDHWYGRLVEFGHAIVRVTNRVRNAKGRTVRRVVEVSGQVPPHPFLRPALDEKRKEANARVAEILRRRLGL
ncbi:MAG: HK97-gp10 family putative phage morphogenesis protein [Bacillota bacterium]